MELPRSEDYYDLTVLTYNNISKALSQAAVKRVIQFCGYFLYSIIGKSKSTGTYIEFAYRLFVTERHSYSYIQQGYKFARYATPILDGMPMYFCAIVRQKDNIEVEQLVDAVSLFSGYRQKAMVAIMLSRTGNGVLSKIARLKRSDYDIEKGTLCGYTLPEWANNFVRYAYIRETEMFPDSNMLFQWMDAKKLDYESRAQLASAIAKVKKKHWS